MAKTNLELYLSAQAAAQELMATKSNHQVHGKAYEIFNAQGNDPLDWDYWHGQFGTLRQYMIGLSTQKTASAVAAEKEDLAAKKRAAASPAPVAPVATEAPAPVAVAPVVVVEPEKETLPAELAHNPA
jgi:hypothetical protein